MDLIVDFVKFVLGCPFRVGKSYFAIILFGALLIICTTLLVSIIAFIGNGFSLSAEVYMSMRFEVTSLIINLIYNLNYYLFTAIIIYVCMEIGRVKYVSFGDIGNTLKKHYKPLLSLIFITLVIRHLIALSLGGFKKPEEQWISDGYLYLLLPLINMCFMICVTALMMNKSKIKSLLKTLWKVLNVARYPFLMIIFISCIVAIYLPTEVTNLVRNQILMRLYEENRMEISNFTLVIVFGFQLINILISMIVISMASAAAIYTVRSIIIK